MGGGSGGEGLGGGIWVGGGGLDQPRPGPPIASGRPCLEGLTREMFCPSCGRMDTLIVFT